MVLNGWDKPENGYIDNIQDVPYDQHTDDTIEAILGVIEDMKYAAGEGGNRDKKLWLMAEMVEKWSKNSNFSDLSRQTGIPRTTIAKEVAEGLEYIKQVLKNNNIDYDPT